MTIKKEDISNQNNSAAIQNQFQETVTLSSKVTKQTKMMYVPVDNLSYKVLDIPRHHIAAIIGNDGNSIQKIRDRFGVEINIVRTNTRVPYAVVSSNDQSHKTTSSTKRQQPRKYQKNMQILSHGFL